MSALKTVTTENWFHQTLQTLGLYQGAAKAPASDFLQAARTRGESTLSRLGLPSRRNETWRYTNVDNLLKLQFACVAKPAENVDLSAVALLTKDCYRVVFVNGCFQSVVSIADSLPQGVVIGSLNASMASHEKLLGEHFGKAQTDRNHVFAALNLASSVDGLFVYIPAGVKLVNPIEVIYLTQGSEQAVLAQPRNLILVDQGAQATVIEHFVGSANTTYLNNSVTEVIVRDGAQLEHSCFQDQSQQAYHFHSRFVSLNTNARYKSSSFALGGKLAREDIEVAILGAGVDCKLDGLYTIGDQQLCDYHINVEHRVAGSNSTERFKGILFGKGRAVFDGRILVEKNAQQTNAQLSNDNLLLCRDAEVDTKPQLEIYADDVKCSHGTTVGQLDPLHLFYLRSRGIALADAKKMLALGFAGELTSAVSVAAVADRVDLRLQQLLMKPSQNKLPPH